MLLNLYKKQMLMLQSLLLQTFFLTVRYQLIPLRMKKKRKSLNSLFKVLNRLILKKCLKIQVNISKVNNKFKNVIEKGGAGIGSAFIEIFYMMFSSP